MNLEELKVYQLSMEMAEKVRSLVLKWDYFTKDIIGKQLIKVADSVAANLCEGFGRYIYKLDFCMKMKSSKIENT